MEEERGGEKRNNAGFVPEQWICVKRGRGKSSDKKLSFFSVLCTYLRTTVCAHRRCFCPHLGNIMYFECLFVFPGKPLPKVLWYMDDVLIDETFQQTYEGTVKNGLAIRDLGRAHARGRLRCIASNNNITRPAEAETRIRMLCELILYSCWPSFATKLGKVNNSPFLLQSLPKEPR